MNSLQGTELDKLLGINPLKNTIPTLPEDLLKSHYDHQANIDALELHKKTIQEPQVKAANIIIKGLKKIMKPFTNNEKLVKRILYLTIALIICEMVFIGFNIGHTVYSEYIINSNNINK